MLKKCIFIIAAAVMVLPGMCLAKSNDCPERMVSVEGRYCIDVYEYPNAKGAQPTGNIRWDEADAACKKEGKRLCSFQEWSKACAGPNNTKYPYGNEYRKGACRDANAASEPGKRTSGTYDKCVSGYGARDMSGGNWEWTSDKYNDGQNRGIQGGSVNSDPADLACGEPIMESAGWVDETSGFRCCGDIVTPPKPVAIESKQPEKTSPAQTSAPRARAIEPSPLTRYPLPSVAAGFYAGAEYEDPGKIVKSDAYNMNVSASGIALTAGYRIDKGNVEYTRVEYRLKSVLNGVSESKSMSANIFGVSAFITPARDYFSWSGGVMIGARRYDDSYGHINEGYIGKEFSRNAWTIVPAVNVLSPTSGKNKTGVSIDASYHATPRIDLIGRYSSASMYKMILNNFLVPYTQVAGYVDCTDCDISMSSAGISYELQSGRGGVYFMINDLQDLQIPVGGAQIRF
ncbi:MAG: SUMF1/EgtB/PvdO family nonheme iron enzyme [bacterium]